MKTVSVELKQEKLRTKKRGAHSIERQEGPVFQDEKNILVVPRFGNIQEWWNHKTHYSCLCILNQWQQPGPPPSRGGRDME